MDETTFSALPGVGQAGRLAGRLQGLIRTEAIAWSAPPTAPKTSFIRRVSSHRRFAFGSLDWQRVKTVKNVYEVTVNDVVMSMWAGAVRRGLLDHKELPDQPLVAQVPVSVRTREQAGTYSCCR